MIRILIFTLVACGAADPVRELEDRLYAPCCKRQSLHDHESPVATQVRAEIRARIARGEASDAIERDLVARYGDEIRVTPASIPVGLAGILVGLVGAIAMVRFVRRRRVPMTAPAEGDPNSIFEDRLDDELAKLD
jgi:cytochrome c-type biogenesis protein CcmH